MESNLALVAHNTKIATNIAKELSQLKSTQRQLAHEARRKPTTSYIVE